MQRETILVVLLYRKIYSFFHVLINSAFIYSQAYLIFWGIGNLRERRVTFTSVSLIISSNSLHKIGPWEDCYMDEETEEIIKMKLNPQTVAADIFLATETW